MQFLTTDFWKHGQAGIIDIADKIYPTFWYGKQHPFEVEFVVTGDPRTHKIFDNLQIIGNRAEPESFHYEIVGDCYAFAEDKKNMYIRQEATKELYQFNGADIVYNEDYKELSEDMRPIADIPQFYKKSTIFPAYYYRKDTINEIEDSYHLFTGDDTGENVKNFSALAGAEIVRYKNLNEYRIWNHAKAVDIQKNGRMRGNMHYKEDKWYVQINPINIVQKNELKSDWDNKYKQNNNIPDAKLVPAELNLFKAPEDLFKPGTQNNYINLPNDWSRNIVQWNNLESKNSEIKMKDKYIKIRVRYSGKDLAVIAAINTLYSISYS